MQGKLRLYCLIKKTTSLLFLFFILYPATGDCIADEFIGIITEFNLLSDHNIEIISMAKKIPSVTLLAIYWL